MLVLFSIIVIGSIIGKLSLSGFGLKGAGVLIVAMVFGHYGYQIPLGVSELGLLLFVYAVGLQAGSRFFRYFRQHPKTFIMLGVIPIAIAGAMVLALSAFTDLPHTLLLGLFSGALTNTPSLASTVDYFSGPDTIDGKLVSVGYGIAYPFGMLGVAIFVQVLPGIFKKNLKDEAEQMDTLSDKELVVKHFRVNNPNCFGRTIKELNTRRIAGANISRVTRNGESHISKPDFKLEENDIVTAVCEEESAHALRLMFGDEVTNIAELGKDIMAVDLEVSLPELTGKSLQQLKFVSEYGVVITRVKRQGVEFSPSATTVLDFADIIRIVGVKDSVEKFSKLLGKGRARIQETDMLPFISGILLGTLIGSIPLTIGKFADFKLGLSGGCFLVALILGHFGKIGSWKIYVPLGASNLCRDLGIMLFMAGAGVSAGSNFIETVSTVGISVISFGALITSVYIFITFLLTYFLLKNNMLYSLGLVCGVANNSLPLGYLKESSKSDYASFAYATVYPVSLIVKIVVAQLLLKLLV